MSEPTGPLPVLTDTAALVAVVNQAIGEIRRLEDLIRQDIALRGPLTELVMTSTRLAEMEDTFRRGTTQQLTRVALEGPPLTAVPPLPAPSSHRRKRSRRLPGQGQATLWPVPVIIAAFAGLKHALRHSAAAHAIGAHASLKVAAWATAGTLSAGAITGVAVVGAHVLGVGASPAGSATSGPAPAASIYAASPFGSVPVAALTRPKTGTADARRARPVAGGFLPAPPYTAPSSPSSQPSSAQSQPSASSQAQAQGGPAVLGGVPSTIDLSSGNPYTFTLSASGSGWVAWRADPGIDPLTGVAQADVDFSTDNGVLAAGATVQVTVSVDVAQQTDGNTSETFEIDGQTVTVQLPAPVAQPSPAVTGTDTPTPDPTSS